MAPEGPIRIGGVPVRRIVIVTVRMEPCACVLARRLRACGAEITIVSQRRLGVEPDSPAFFRRLLARRGWRIALDYLLLHALRSTLRAVRPSRGPDAPAVLRQDPGIRRENWLRVIDVDDVNRPPDRDLLRSLEPDLLLLAGAPILSRSTIGLARVACLNPHCGITPDYAGSSPFEWALFERRFDDVGYTVHVVVPTVDGGPVLRQERVPWDPRSSSRALWPLLAERMYEALALVAESLVRGEILEARPQPPVRVNPPAGLIAKGLAELRRARYARRRATNASRA